MNVYDARGLAAEAVSAHLDRPASALIHDAADARVLLFRIEPGQRVPVHTSTSTVILMVVSGSGIVTGADGDRVVRAGDVVAYEVGEHHGMTATNEQLVIAAMIAPRPGTR